MIRSALSGDVHWQCGKSHPAFNLHTFRPWESCPSGLKFLIFKSGQQAQILPWWYIFSRAAGKMVHRLPQRVTGVRKIFLTVGQKEYHLGQKRVIRWIISALPGNPLVSWYFGFWKWAMVKVLGLDNREWKDVPYYPYDLVHAGNRK